MNNRKEGFRRKKHIILKSNKIFHYHGNTRFGKENNKLVFAYDEVTESKLFNHYRLPVLLYIVLTISILIIQEHHAYFENSRDFVVKHDYSIICHPVISADYTAHSALA